MNFKEEYTELQNNITPDAAFLEQLARKMELEKKRRRKKTRSIFVSAAALCTSAAAALIVIVNLPGPEPAPVKTDNIKFSYTVGLFTNNESFSTERPIPEQLAQMLSESETALYKSDENKFNKDCIQNENQRIALAEKIKYAREIDSATESAPGKSADHYMMVLDNGDVFKFRISGNVLEINDKFYRIP